MAKDIVVVVDYHDRTSQFRMFNEVSERESCEEHETEPGVFEAVVTEAGAQARRQGGRVVWVMESTNGWARMKKLLGRRAELVLANVVQMPLPPKARRRKTDKLDTARVLREYRNGTLPRSYQPAASVRRLRRLVGLEQSLVRRRTALRNWVNRYLSHETWERRSGLWNKKAMQGLWGWARGLAGHDRFTVASKREQLVQVEEQLRAVQGRLERIARRWVPARRLDAIRGLGPMSAVGIAACIGRIERFGDAEQLIAYAGLAPSVRSSSQWLRAGHIGGGGTDALLRHLIVEATVWAREIPRYRRAYQRSLVKHESKIARLVVGRLLLRGIDAVLRRGVEFDPGQEAEAAGASPSSRAQSLKAAARAVCGK